MPEQEATTAETAPHPQAPRPRFYIWGVGRRKSPSPGCASRPAPERSRSTAARSTTTSPASAIARQSLARWKSPIPAARWTLFVNASGGGQSGQAGAIVMGSAARLARYDSGLEAALRGAEFMTRDSRMKERKKYGQRGAPGASSSPSDDRIGGVFSLRWRRFSVFSFRLSAVPAGLKTEN